MPVSLLMQFLDALLRLILMLIFPQDSPIFVLVYVPIFLVFYFGEINENLKQFVTKMKYVISSSLK